MSLVIRAFLAPVPALAVVVIAAWLAFTPALLIYLQAALWTCSFVFLGLSIDTQKPSNGLSLATGVALPVLADLSAMAAVEFAIGGAAIIGVWLCGAIWLR